MSDASTVVLLSGGLDSAVVAAALAAGGQAPTALFLNYGQPAAKLERLHSKNIADHLQITWNERNLTPISHPATGSPDNADYWHFPNRTLHLVSAALQFAPNASLIALGSCLQDSENFPDAAPEFLGALELALAALTGDRLLLYTPLTRSTKLEIIALAHLHHLPLALTRSCLTDQPEACNHCPACRIRNLACEQARTLADSIPSTR